MRLKSAITFGVAVVLGLSATPWAQATAVLWLEPPEATINPGQTVAFEVFIDAVPVLMRGYQTQIDVGVAEGTLGAPCAPPDPPPDGVDPVLEWCHFDVFIDQEHPDFVYRDPGLGLLHASASPMLLRLTGVLMEIDAGVIVTEPQYLGTYELKAPDDALGVFTLAFVPADTFLRESGGGVVQIPILSMTGATITIMPPPPNDACADAELLTVPSSVPGSTVDGNVDSGVPACGPSPDSPGVWYRLLGTGNQVMTASLCDGASYDTRLTVYEGTNCGALKCVADMNDTCDSGSQEEVAWCAVSGGEYWILVHGIGGATGSFTLDVSVEDCDDGNDCTDDLCEEGVCPHANSPSGTPCGDPSDTDCDRPDTCDGAGACRDNLEPDGTVCTDDGDVCTRDVCEDNTCTHARWPVDDDRACGACCYVAAGLCYDEQREDECRGGVWAVNGLCAGRDVECEKVIVPTVSQWGLVVISLLLAVGIATKFGPRQRQAV